MARPTSMPKAPKPPPRAPRTPYVRPSRRVPARDAKMVPAMELLATGSSTRKVGKLLKVAPMTVERWVEGPGKAHYEAAVKAAAARSSENVRQMDETFLAAAPRAARMVTELMDGGTTVALQAAKLTIEQVREIDARRRRELGVLDPEAMTDEELDAEIEKHAQARRAAQAAQGGGFTP